jgi:hypothetical protein
VACSVRAMINASVEVFAIEAMALHLEEISPDAHALVLLDQAGWHVSQKVPIPDNITLLNLL